MKRDRYSLNDRSQRSPIDGRQRAKSARSQPTVRASGGNGRNGSNSTADPTAGLHADGTPSRRMTRTDRNGRIRVESSRGNTMRTTYRGGLGVYYFDPEEAAKPALEYSDKSGRMTARAANRKIERIDPAVVGHDPKDLRRARANARKIAGQESVAAGLRQEAMARHSIMVGAGAIGTRTESMNIPDGYWPNGELKFRLIMVTVPVWSDDPEDDPAEDE